MAVRQTQGGYLNFNTYEPEYIGRPIEALGTMMGRMNENSKAIVDKTSALDLALSNFDIHGDEEYIRNNRKQELQSGVQAIINSGGSDFGLAEAKINKVSMDFQKDKDLQHAISGKQKYDNYREKSQADYGSGVISKEQNTANIMEQYQKVRKENGMYVEPMYYQQAKQIDMNPVIAKVVASLPKNVTQTLFTPIRQKGDTNPYHIIGEEQTSTSQRDIGILEQAITAAYDDTPGAKSYIKDQARALIIIDGQEPTPEAIEAKSSELINNMVESYVRTGGAPQSMQNVEKGNTVPLMTARAKDAIDNEQNNSTWTYPAELSKRTGSTVSRLNEGADVNIMSDMGYGFDTEENSITGYNNLQTIYKEPAEKPKLDSFFKYGGTEYNSIEDVNTDNYNDFYDKISKFSEANYKNEISHSVNASYDKMPKAQKNLATALFGKSDFSKTSKTGFAIPMDYSQVVMYDMEGDEILEGREAIGDFLNEASINDNGDETNKLAIRAVSSLNPSNPIPYKTGNFAFAEGATVYSLNGKLVAAIRKPKDIRGGTVRSIYERSTRFPNQEMPLTSNTYQDFIPEGTDIKGYNVYFVDVKQGGDEDGLDLQVEYTDKTGTESGTDRLEEMRIKLMEHYNIPLDNEE